MGAIFVLLASSWGASSQTTDALLPIEDPGAIAEVPTLVGPLTGIAGGTLPQGAVELEDRRELNSKTYILPSGELVTRISMAPLHYLDGERWQDIDPTLRADGDGFSNDANTL